MNQIGNKCYGNRIISTKLIIKQKWSKHPYKKTDIVRYNENKMKRDPTKWCLEEMYDHVASKAHTKKAKLDKWDYIKLKSCKRNNHKNEKETCRME